MEHKTYVSFLLFLFSFSIASGQMIQGVDTLVGNEWIRYDQRHYKFLVDQDGIYRIDNATLEIAGISPADIIGTNFRLYNMGRQVPLFVSTDGLFGTGDFIEFFGYKNRGQLDQYLYLRPAEDMLHPGHSLYTDNNAYYLTIGGVDPPLRVNNLVNDLSNPPAAEEFYLHKEEVSFNAALNDPYYQVAGGGSISYSSYLHGEGFCKANEMNSSSQIPSINRFAGGPDAILHLRMASTNYSIGFTHNFVVSFNNQTMDTITATDLQIKDFTYTIPLSLLADLNTLNLTSLNPQSRHSLVTIELTYPRITIISSAQTSIILEGQAGNQHLILSGFTHHGLTPIVYSYDGTDRMVAAISGSDIVEFLWPETQNDLQLYIADPAAGIRLISTLEAKDFTDITTDNTEYIVITHPDLMEIGTGSEYIQYRSSAEGGSYLAKAYSILDLYDQFGYGIEKHPQSIRNFVEFFDRNWPSAKMIFIVGRGIEYNRSRYPGTGWEHAFFVPTFGRPGADNLLAATVWDLVPRYPIGRLAVFTPQDLSVYLEKVKEYDAVRFAEQTLEDKAWIKNVMHISGGKTSGEQADFKNVLGSLGEEITKSDFGAKVSFFQKQSTDIIGESQSKQIERLLHEGGTIINYLGHSSSSTFEFTINDPSEWNNKGRYPIFSAMGCSAGQIHSTLPSLSDRYVFVPNEGCISFISGSGSQFASALINWAEPWYDFIGEINYEGTLGESILHGLREVGNSVNPQLNGSNQYRYLLEQQTFQGDPALRWHPMPGPDYLVDRSSVSITPDILNTKLDSFDIAFSIFNLGRNLGEIVEYTIQIKFPDGHKDLLKKDQVPSSAFETRVSVRLPLNIGKKAGIYRLLITVDPDNLREELPLPQAENNNQLIDNLGIEGIEFVVVDNVVSAIYPPDFAIVNNTLPEMVATSSNSFVKSQDFVLEIDTTALFNSPSLYREKLIDRKGTIKWSPQINYIPDQVYYWRVSTDSISPVPGYIWSRRSFIYKPGSPNGWNQSHFHQFTDDHLSQLLPDSIQHEFKFTSQVSNFRILNRFHNGDVSEIPFGFIDGVFYTEFFSKFVNNNVHVFVVAIDPVTGEFMTNPNPGLYGSFNNLSYDTKCFAYRTDLPDDRQALINFVENIIPDDFLVFFYTYQRPAFPDYFPEQWASDEAIYGKSIFSIIENQYPTSEIRTLATSGSVPYIVFFQKGKDGIEEVIAEDTTEAISVSYDIQKSLAKGTFISTLIGPASSWSAIQWNYSTPPVDTAGINILSARAISSDLSDTILISANLISHDTSITTLNANVYPYLQLSFFTEDSVFYHPSDIIYWRVLYEGYPEFIINPDLGFEFIADTLFQGEQLSLSTHIENVADEDVDSLRVSFRIISENNTTEELNYLINHINGHSSAPVSFQKITSQMFGDYRLVLDVNPGRMVNEENYTNNVGLLATHIKGDQLNPVLDVTFDGQHILDGDLVASKPLIAIQLHDENEYLRLDDTSSFTMFLQYPSDTEPRLISFSEEWVQFISSGSSGKNIATVELRPELLEDGIYSLQIKAKDASGNLSGDNDYLISFEVINAESISHLYNYPNPFSTLTRFVYTLTGEGSPPYYKIQIMSVSGKIVREITQSELGALIVGTHMTDYVWDGTDENGGRLAAGTYLYRMIVKNENLEDFDHYETSEDNTFFNKGWGKLVILR